MTPERFEHLHGLVAPFISKKKCRSRESISSAERLVIALRYLATGDSQQSQAFTFRVGRSTVCKIISETCDGIWDALQEQYLKAPESEDDWRKIAEDSKMSGIFQTALVHWMENILPWSAQKMEDQIIIITRVSTVWC